MAFEPSGNPWTCTAVVSTLRRRYSPSLRRFEFPCLNLDAVALHRDLQVHPTRALGATEDDFATDDLVESTVQWFVQQAQLGEPGRGPDLKDVVVVTVLRSVDAKQDRGF